jgi:predicted acyltransferase
VSTQAVSEPPSVTRASSSERLLSLDALRGFDMFWIVGAEEIVHALHKSGRGPIIDFLSAQLTHKPWAGLVFYDLIFPLFVFIVGVSIVFSVNRMIEQSGRAVAYRRIFIRSALLFLFGIIYSGGLAKGFEGIRLLGVLQRIALCYFCAAMLFATVGRRALVGICFGLLLGYWALMTFVPVPGVGTGNFNEGTNLANYIDQQYLPLRKYDRTHDPEGLLGTLPAIATCLLGVFAGLLLKDGRLSAQQKVYWLAGAGALALAAGYLWSIQFPLIKKIWTSSYVLVAAGYSSLLLAAFYQIVDIWKWRKWAQPFVWIGLNPIVIYLAWELFPFSDLAQRLVGGPIKASFGSYAEALVSACALALVFLLAWFLHRRKLFLRV